MLTSRITLAAALLFGVTTAVALRAQAPASASASTDAVAALVAEVRALRTELSQVASANVRSQLLVTRIQLQEQRLMHLDRQRAEVSAKLGEAERMRTMFAAQMKQFEQHSDKTTAEERRNIDDAIGGLKPQLQAAEASATTLRGEQDALLNAMASEQSRWTDFNGRLDELERSLPIAGTGLRTPGTVR